MSNKDDCPVEVVPSGAALLKVSSWLGVNPDDALDQVDEEPETKRPLLLGLGAKYLPHSKVTGTAGLLDDSLRKRLVKRQKDYNEGMKGSTVGKGGTKVNLHQARSGHKHALLDKEDASDVSEEDGRAKRFSKQTNQHNSLQDRAIQGIIHQKLGNGRPVSDSHILISRAPSSHRHDVSHHQVGHEQASLNPEQYLSKEKKKKKKNKNKLQEHTEQHPLSDHKPLPAASQGHGVLTAAALHQRQLFSVPTSENGNALSKKQKKKQKRLAAMQQL